MHRHVIAPLPAPDLSVEIGSVDDKLDLVSSSAISSGCRMRRLVVASLTAAGLSVGFGGAASAADLPPAPVYTKVPIAPVYNWTGCYVGVHAGGGLIETTFIGHVSDQGGGGLIGGQTGCNYQTGQFVFGVEGEGAWSGMTSRFSQQFFDGASSLESVRNRWDADISLRVGFAIDRTLVYGKAGAALGNFEFKQAEANEPFSRSSAHGESTLGGLLLGAGVEYGFAPSWTAKLEYNFIGFADKDVHFNTLSGPETETEAARKQIVKVGVNYRFGN
jgi:outer membrane immunogenic protein